MVTETMKSIKFSEIDISTRFYDWVMDEYLVKTGPQQASIVDASWPSLEGRRMDFGLNESVYLED